MSRECKECPQEVAPALSTGYIIYVKRAGMFPAETEVINGL